MTLPIGAAAKRVRLKKMSNAVYLPALRILIAVVTLIHFCTVCTNSSELSLSFSTQIWVLSAILRKRSVMSSPCNQNYTHSK
jgi:hypothetical protein